MQTRPTPPLPHITRNHYPHLFPYTPAIPFLYQSRTVLPPLPTKKPQPPVLRLECNHTALREEKDIALCSLDALSALIRDVKVAIYDNLHFVIGVGVDKRGARVEAVEAGGDGGGGVGGAVFAVVTEFCQYGSFLVVGFDGWG